jgi:hypothetical protein
MSGAADIILQLMEDADDSEFPHSFLASEDFCDILDAKLLLKGNLPVCGSLVLYLYIMQVVEFNSIGRRCAKHASF